MAEVIKIDETTYRIEDGMVRFFVLEGSEKALVIDTGMTTANAREIVESVTKLPLLLVNTHADRDHIGGNAGFEQFHMNLNDAARLDDKMGNESKNGTDDTIADGRSNTDRVIPVSTGFRFDLGGRTVEVIDLPGHTPGSIALLDIEKRVLYGGDSIQDGNIYMFGEGRNLEQYIASFDNLKPYADKFDAVYPSHGSLPVYPELIERLKDAARKILNGEAEGKEVDLWGNKVILYKFDCAGFLRT